MTVVVRVELPEVFAVQLACASARVVFCLSVYSTFDSARDLR